MPGRPEAQSAATTLIRAVQTGADPGTNRGEPQWPREPHKQQNAVIVPFIAVDRGYAVDPVRDDPPDPPPGPDPPPNTAKRTLGMRGGGKRPMGRTRRRPPIRRAAWQESCGPGNALSERESRTRDVRNPSRARETPGEKPQAGKAAASLSARIAERGLNGRPTLRHQAPPAADQADDGPASWR
jgi:hypothetical protein